MEGSMLAVHNATYTQMLEEIQAWSADEYYPCDIGARVQTFLAGEGITWDESTEAWYIPDAWTEYGMWEVDE